MRYLRKALATALFAGLLLAQSVTMSVAQCLPAVNASADGQSATPEETSANRFASSDRANLASSQAPAAETASSPFIRPAIVQGDSLSHLSDQIAARELELLRMNTSYRIESTPVSRWKPWRQAFFGLAQYGCSNAGIDLITYARWHYWRFPKRAPRRLLQAGPLMLLIGHSIGLGGLVIETALDAAGDYKRHRKGFDRRQFLRHTAELEQGLDGLLVKRQAMLSAVPAEERQMADAETALLKDVRDAAIEENMRLNVRAARWKASRNTNAFMSAAGLATGGYIGALMSLLGVNEHKPRFLGPAGLGFTLSGAFIIFTPVAGRVNAGWIGKLARRSAQEKLGSVPASARASLAADHLALANLVGAPTAANAAFANRLKVYELAQQALGIQSDLARDETKQASKDFAERMVSAGIIGGTKMGYGIQLMNAGCGFHKPVATPPVKFKLPVGGTKVTFTKPTPRGANELFSRRVAQAATTFLPGTAYGILDVLQSRIRGEIKSESESKAGTSPAQRLHNRLQLLEQADGMLKSPKISSTENRTLD